MMNCDLQNRVKALESGGELPAAKFLPNEIKSPIAEPAVVTRPAPIEPQSIPKQEDLVKTEPQKNEANSKEHASVTEEFTPPPVSKKSDGKDLASMWQMLLANIKSPSTQALLKLAKPVSIAPEGVVITFRNDRLVSQINDTNKKQLIVDAANTMFNQKDTKVTIKMAQFGDNKTVINTAEPAEDEDESETEEAIKISPAPVVQKQDREIEPEEIKENLSQDQQLSKEEDKKDKERIESDQEKMVIELFDGKYVE